MNKLFISLSFLLFVACNSNKKAVTDNPETTCKTEGTVKDFRGLDGCNFLIVLDNGEKLNPVKSVQEDFEYKDGQRVKFDYNALQGLMTICMTENLNVEITCIEALEGVTAKPCADTKNPFEVAWMNRALDRYNPTQIIKFKKGEEWLYHFTGLPSSYLFDCRGELLCENSTTTNKECTKKYLADVDKGKVVWQGEGIWD